MTDILDLPDWTLIDKRSDGDEYELEAEYRLLPRACVKCGSVGRLYKHGTKDTTFRRGERSTNHMLICPTCHSRFHTKPHAPSSAASTR
jgi:5-methylcytosine-specific restriction endonuclease McrA